MSAVDWDQRRLCADGGCVGVIGADGICKVCGTRDDGAPQVASPAAALALDDEGAAEDDDYDDEEDGDDDEAYSDEDDEDYEDDPADGAIAADGVDAADGVADDRELCPDGACVGLIGADRRCKVCGAVAA